MDLKRFQAAVAADPIRQWMGAQIGRAGGAEEALAAYDALFRSYWLQQELAHDLAALGERANTVIEICGEALTMQPLALLS